MSKRNSNGKKPWSLTKKIILICTSVIAAAIIGIAIWLAPGFFNHSVADFKSIGDSLPSATAAASPGVSGVSDEPSASVSLDPNAVLAAQADLSGLDNIVNILLIGVDYAPERDTWNGKHQYHADVMIVLSINRATNQVSLISLPRDSYSQNPVDPNGIYKINTSLNTGGVWPDTADAACQQVCAAASWMIGGLPIPYYYAVDMDAVKSLVDSIGRVNYNLDISFTMQGRTYTKGQQYMDGQAVLDYLRVRKNADSSHDGIIYDSKGEPDQSKDSNRVIRQRNMLKAILAKIKSDGTMWEIPNILSSLSSGHLITNVPLDLTTKLAGYALSINPDNIQSYSMSGDYINGVFGSTGFAFTFTDQDNRASILQQVYGLNINDKAAVAAARSEGINVPDNYSDYSYGSANKLGEKMQIYVTDNASRPILDKIKGYLDADALLPDAPTSSPTTSPTEPTAAPTETASPSPTDEDDDDDTVNNAVSSVNVTTAQNVSYDDTGYRKYYDGGAVWTLYNTCETEYDELDGWDTSKTPTNSEINEFNTLISKFQTDVENLAANFSIKVPDSTWNVTYNTFDGKVNQPYKKDTVSVDFS